MATTRRAKGPCLQALQESFFLNFIFSVLTHQYFMLVVLGMTYSKNKLVYPLAITLLLPIAGKRDLNNRPFY